MKTYLACHASNSSTRFTGSGVAFARIETVPGTIFAGIIPRFGVFFPRSRNHPREFPHGRTSFEDA